METISVIIPVYKVEEYLDRCVESVLCQTYKELEIWLVDDGSPDGCPEMCDEWAKKDSRIKVIHKKNGGLSDARNAALDVITGKYVCFVDSDDWISETALEDMYDALVSFDTEISMGNIYHVDEKGNYTELFVPTDKKLLLENDEILTVLNRPNACGKLYCSELFKTVRYPVGKLYEDVFTWHKILSQVNKIVFTGKINYYYLVRSDSIMHGEYNIRFTDIIDAIKERYEWLESIGQKELALDARLFIYSRVAVAHAHLDKANPEHKKRLDEIDIIYNDCYKVLMKSKSIGLKQKLRLWLLKYLPCVHTRFFGKNMPLALG